MRNFLVADIPLKKLDNPKLRNFLEKWTQQHVPETSTVRKNYLQSCYNKIIRQIRNSVAESDIWISDETTDVEDRVIANYIVGTLHSDNKIF